MALSTGGISYGASIGLSFRTDDGDLVSRLLKASRSLEGAALTAVKLGAVDDAQDMGCRVCHDAKAARMSRWK